MQQAVLHGGAMLDAAQHALQPGGADHGQFVQLAQAGPDGISASDYARRVQEASRSQEQQLGWLTNLGKHFIGVFQKGGEVFSGFVTGIIPTLIVLMTAFYAVTEFVGEKRVHGIAQTAGRYALTRYTVLPLLAVFFLTNPMAYTFGTFLEEKHKPAFYDSAVSFVHPVLGLFPHANPGEYFVWGGVLVALMELEKAGKVPAGYHVTIAIYYFAVGLVVILLKGIVTEWITRILARRQGVTL
ncbi:PTS glucitol/sorbitol transporter subunit IIC [Acetobacteraceae bacterium H6797]|nr:PTS glucitol/sorbitol transporter subunit IIC [Acetobacteraceae bacterium H6797]